ncbi:MAG: hypothetical protein NC341_01295 [Blautia sp.]|nr:hypothetical protein [Blautia sp.]MCM1201133.1 hypothetical protein [Bacteroides fragilis]
MKKVLKKISAILLAGAMAVSLAGCGNGSQNASNSGSAPADSGTESNDSGSAESAPVVEGKDCTIGVAFYQDTGLAVDATKAYLESLSDTLNVKFTYTVLTQTDEAANLTKIQELISANVDGIICTMDLGMTSIIQECEAAGVYLGGYLCDYDTSFNTAYDQVFKSEYFVGTATDGQNPDDVTIGTTMFDSLLEYNERNAEAPITHVSMAIFPVWAFPSQQIGADQFAAAVEAYNETAETPITVDPLDEESDVLAFAPLDTTYFAKHADSQAIISFAAGSAFVYPTMVQAGVDSSLKLFTTGYDGGEDANFGTTGNGTYQQNMVTAVESITYPLVLLLNKINGAEFSDQPAEAERISTAQYVINSDEDMAKFQKSCFYTKDAANAMYTPQDVLNMTAYGNPDATYADLKGILSTMTIDSIQ